ncbi:MAG TPA: sterol desaturase family protein [Streptosporangiaceae bacterium]|nr:sterol desaturase family protein [Streptosporangiaceae bacterium]
MSAARIQVHRGAAGGLADLAAAPGEQARTLAAGQASGGEAARRAWWRRLCLPSLALAAITALIVWVAVDTLLRQGRLAGVLSAGRAELAAPLLIGLVVATGICERIWPAERRPLLARGHVQDVAFLALHAIVVIPLMTLLSVGAATLLEQHVPWLELRATQDWPAWLLFPLTIVAMDAANWLAHYADHRLGALWRFHALHHSQEELSVFTSFRAHPLMHTTGFLLATIPVVVLMPGRPIAPVLITIYICIGTLQHANLRWTFGPAGKVIVSPAYHRFHHAPDVQGDNLGVVLTVWDVLAGRARFPDRAGYAGRTGLAGRPVPVEQDTAARPVPLLLAEQLIEPFQARG